MSSFILLIVGWQFLTILALSVLFPEACRDVYKQVSRWGRTEQTVVSGSGLSQV